LGQRILYCIFLDCDWLIRKVEEAQTAWAFSAVSYLLAVPKNYGQIRVFRSCLISWRTRGRKSFLIFLTTSSVMLVGVKSV